MWGFAPKTTDAPEGSDQDLYDIVVTTDVLAEGVNLQQAGNIINYDLPWNPMRLVQRHGRIDRIGSHHQQIVIRCVFPDTRLDQLLNLAERLQQQIEQLPWGSGSAMTIPTPGISAPGYVFCARVADRKQPLFRYVGPGDEGTPIPDTLACLDRGPPTPSPRDTPHPRRPHI